MDYITVGQKYNEGKIAKIKCFRNSGLGEIKLAGERFLLIVLTEGELRFRRKGANITAAAPCFVCFNETVNPVLTSEINAAYYCIYFHPDFLNINLSFELLRSKKYEDLAQTHDMFLLRPFLDNAFVIPIFQSFVEQAKSACFFMEKELAEQRDWYWSCRGRSYFMELIIALERMYGLIEFDQGKSDANDPLPIKSPKLRDALLFIEGHYMNELTLSEISKAARINHTTLTKLIKEETGMTVFQYLYHYRAQAAKKQLEFTDVPIKDIACRTGFKTVQHFHRAFVKLTGETPAQFRKNAVQKRKEQFQ